MTLRLAGAAVMSLLLGGGSAAAQVVMSDGFETGSYAPSWELWLQSGNCSTDSSLVVNRAAAHSGSFGVDIRYVLDDSPRGDCQLHQDNNTSLVYDISPNLDHFFFRGYFKLGVDPSQLCNYTIQRKLIYFKSPSWGTGQTQYDYIVNLWPWGTNCSTNGYNVSLTYGGTDIGTHTLWGDGSPGFVTGANHVYAGRWYYVEIEAHFRTYGNDIVRMWLAEDGRPATMIFERTDLTLRSQTAVSQGLKTAVVELGRQIDLTRYDDGGVWKPAVDEHRYWDDVVLSQSYVGAGSQSPPNPPPEDVANTHRTDTR